MPTPRIANLDPDRLSSIMNAAVQEFASYSFEHASFNRIIRNSGLSKGSLYYYFNSKEDLFVTIMERCIETLTPKISPQLTMTDPKQFWAETKRLLTKVFQF